MSENKRLALRFISGKYQGGEFPLPDNAEVVIGRSSDLDMVLVEDMVSRRHARILCTPAEITIEDLGSTNGTFVNGEKISRAALHDGDRVLVGTNILKVVSVEAGPLSSALGKTRVEPPAAARSTQTKASTMSGAIEEIPLPDLLQLLGTSKKSGVLAVRSDGDTGRIYLRQGAVYFASINDLTDVSALKSAYRMLTWTQGTFDFEPPDPRSFPGEVDVSVQEVLMEGFRQLDELNAIRAKLPPFSASLSVPHPLPSPLRELSAEELDLFQVALGAPTVAALLNQASTTDLETAGVLSKLIGKGYVRVT